MNKKLFEEIKVKYPVAAMIILIVAALLGKPIWEDEQPQPNIDQTAVTETSIPEEQIVNEYTFRSEEQYISHYEKHGIEMGFASAEEYLAAANKVISSPDALYKLEAEDNDHVYYLEATNEFVVLSKDGYIRTYFLPSAGIDYFNRQ